MEGLRVNIATPHTLAGSCFRVKRTPDVIIRLTQRTLICRGVVPMQGATDRDCGGRLRKNDRKVARPFQDTLTSHADKCGIAFGTGDFNPVKLMVSSESGQA